MIRRSFTGAFIFGERSNSISAPPNQLLKQYYHTNRLTVNSMVVPTLAQVRLGARVSIVLKADQRTGREVIGRVQDVLTRGNHPRGIKVRLQDGRIGRVQRMVEAGADPALENAGETNLNPHTNLSGDSPAQSQFQSIRTSYRSRYRDARFDDNAGEPSPEQVDLMAYVKPGKQKKGRRQTALPAVATGTADISCPVCGEFKGDEAAINHHVETHFENA